MKNINWRMLLPLVGGVSLILYGVSQNNFEITNFNFYSGLTTFMGAILLIIFIVMMIIKKKK